VIGHKHASGAEVDMEFPLPSELPTDEIEEENSTSFTDWLTFPSFFLVDFAMQYIMASQSRGSAAPAPDASACRTERVEYPCNGSGEHCGRYHHHHGHEDYHQQQQGYRHARRRKQLRLQYPDGRVGRRYLLQ